MKTIMTSQVKDGMFLINKKALMMKKETAIQMDSQDPIIESIIETMVESIIFKC